MSYPTLGQFDVFREPVAEMRTIMDRWAEKQRQVIEPEPLPADQPIPVPPANGSVEPPPNGREIPVESIMGDTLPVRPPAPPRRIEEGAATEDVVIAGISVPRVVVLGLGVAVGAMILRNL